MATRIEQIIGDYFKENGYFLCTAESCTGGLVGHLITNVAGSSSYYAGGVIAYAYEVKQRVLGVPKTVLETYGAVSCQTVVAMATGARKLFGADFPLDRLIALSVSGIAGPTGETPTKPVGLVWVGIDSPYGSHAAEFVFHGDRIKNKSLFAKAALKYMYSFLKSENRNGSH